MLPGVYRLLPTAAIRAQRRNGKMKHVSWEPDRWPHASQFRTDAVFAHLRDPLRRFALRFFIRSAMMFVSSM
jgi:hypothetical protein